MLGRALRLGRPLVVALVLVNALAGCGSAKQDPRAPDRRGQLVSAVRVADLTRALATTSLNGAGLPATDVRRGVVAYRLTYRTIDPRGRETTATGLVALPRGSSPALPVVLYAHGSAIGDAEAPSTLRTTEGAPTASLFAADGFAYAAPDYLGLGGGPGPQAYLDARSEATASIDLLRALQTFARRRGIALGSDLYVAGFSQGGQAAMAVAAQLTREPLAGLLLRAVAPIAGPHDLSGATWRALVAHDDPPDPSVPTFLTALLLSWQRAYGIFEDPGAVFPAPGAAAAARLLDGRQDTATVSASLPRTLPQLLEPAALAALRHPTGALARALRANDGCTTVPDAVVRIYQGRADQLVPPENAERCLRRLIAQGGRARIVDLGDVDHFGSLRTALPQVQRWFRLRADALER